MGIIRKGIFGGFNGKVGKSTTIKQLEQRAKFKLAMDFLKTCAPLFKTSYEINTCSVKSGMNIAMQNLLKNAIIGEYPNYKIDYSKVKFSSGSLLIGQIKASKLCRHQLQLTWNPENLFYKCATRFIVNFIHCDSPSNFFYVNSHEVNREDGKASFEIYPKMITEVGHLYYYISSIDGKYSSDTVYAGEVPIE